MKPDTSTTKSRYTIEALVRGLEVLALFTAARPALSFNEIVGALDLSKSTAFRILATQLASPTKYARVFEASVHQQPIQPKSRHPSAPPP